MAARASRPKPKLGRYELAQLGRFANALNEMETVPNSPVSVTLDSIHPTVTVWFENDEDEGWVFTEMEA